MSTQVQIMDVTIRDGGFVNDWQFDKKLVRETYRALSQAGVDFFEIGYRNRRTDGLREEASGPWKFSSEEDIRDVTRNMSGAKLAIMGDQGKVDADDFCQSRDSAVSLIRIASHKTEIKGAMGVLERLKTKGYQVSLNAMGYSNYTGEERDDFARMIKSAGFLDYVYVADSYGSLFPGQIKALFEPLLNIPSLKVGFHPHNNLQMSFANTLEAISCGVHIVDSSIYGMGRAAGNLPTEILVSYLEKKSPDRYNCIPLLNIIDRYFVGIQRETPWGYQLPYMLSGMFQCHPDYAKALLGHREFTIEDIWKALDHIKGQPNAGRFSKEAVNDFIYRGHIGDLAKPSAGLDLSPAAPKVSEKDRPGVSYINRHAGRDILVLANGPSLKDYKPKIDQFIGKYDPIILGANNIGGLFRPHYHAFNNKRRFVEYVDTVDRDSLLLLGEYIPEELIRDYAVKRYESLFYIDEFSDFGIRDGVISANCRTISILLMGVAIVMGAKRVFTVGMDGYMGMRDLHFYEEKNDLEDQEMKMEKHRWCQHYLKQINDYLHENDKEGLHILTPTGYKTFYKGIDNYL